MAVVRQTDNRPARHRAASTAVVPGARGTLRNLPRPVYLVTALFGMTMVCWSFLMPTGRSADEIYHADAGIYLAEHGEWPGFKQLPVTFAPRTPETLGMKDPVTGASYPPLLAASAIPRGERPAYADLRRAEPSGVNNLGQHPPLYYAMLGAVHTVLPPSTELVAEIWWYRLLNALILTPLPLLAAALARTWGGSRPIVLAASWSVFLVPQLAVLGGAVNNDNLLTASAAWVFFGLALVAAGDLRRRTALWVGVSLAVALLSKAFGLLLLPLAALAVLVGWRTTGRLRPAARSAALMAAVAMLGGWWWVHTYLRYGTLQPSGHLPPIEGGPLPVSEGIGPTLEGLFTVVPVRFWAFLSIKDGVDAFPMALSVTLTIVSAALVATMLLRRRVGAADRSVTWSFTVPLLLIVMVLASQILRLYLTTGVVRGLNGRYLFFALLPVLVLVVLSLPPLVRGRERLVTATVMAGGLLFTGWSAQRALGYHWGADRTFEPVADLRGVEAWSPFVPPVTVTVGAVALVVAAVAVWASVRSLLAGNPDFPAAPAGRHSQGPRTKTGDDAGPQEDRVTPADAGLEAPAGSA